MTPLKSSVIDAAIWSFTLESSIMIPEASFTHVYVVYSTVKTYEDRQLTMTICL
jgi:hypothetical protein